MNPTPERRAEFAESLRKAAHLFETTDLPIPWSLTVSIADGSVPDASGNHHAIDSLVGVALIAQRLGSCEKEADNTFYHLKKNLGAGVVVDYLAWRNTVCVPKVVGTKVLPAEPERIIEAKPERTEDVVEWQCQSLLKAAGSVEVPSTPELPAPEVLALGAPIDGEYIEDIPF